MVRAGAGVEQGDSGMQRRTAIVGGAVVLLLILAFTVRGCGLLGGGNGPLTLYGNVDVRQVDLAFRVSGRIARIGPEEGDRVKADEILAELDKQPLTDMLATSDAQLGVAEAELAKARAGSRPQEIGQAEARLAEAQAGLARAREDYERRSGLVKTGAVSQQVFDASEAQYKAAQAQVRAAEQAASLAKAGARVEDREAAAAQMRAARAQRDNARTSLADASLRAPNAGTVLTRAREPGAIVQPGETVLTLTIDRPMRLRAYVGARDLSRLSPGMKAEIRADGNAKTYKGRIAQISPTAEFTPKTVQTEDLRTDLVYRVRVLVDDPDDALRQGQPVTIAIPDARPRG